MKFVLLDLVSGRSDGYTRRECRLEEEEFITSGNWRGKNNSLSRRDVLLGWRRSERHYYAATPCHLSPGSWTGVLEVVVGARLGDN